MAYDCLSEIKLSVRSSSLQEINMMLVFLPAATGVEISPINKIAKKQRAARPGQWAETK